MKSMSLKLSLLSLLIALVSFQFQSCKAKNKDADIRTAIDSRKNTDASFAGVNATVAEGVVTLTGQCADENCKTSAENSVKGIDGVKKVVNNITVVPVNVTADDPLKASVQQVIAKYDGVQADVNNGVATLRGTITGRDKLQELMMEINSLNPSKVENQLVIK